jgi:hypothetical protein
MRVAYRHVLLDSQGIRYRLPSARAELALTFDSPDPHASVAQASSHFFARCGQWKPPAAPGVSDL